MWFEEDEGEDFKAKFCGEAEEGEGFERRFMDEGEGVKGGIGEVGGGDELGMGRGPEVHCGRLIFDRCLEL